MEKRELKGKYANQSQVQLIAIFIHLKQKMMIIGVLICLSAIVSYPSTT